MEEAFHSLAADLEGIWVVHGVGTHEHERRAEFAGLLHDDGAFSEVGGHEHDVGLLADELGELGGEVLVAGAVLHIGNEFAADLLKGLFEEVGEAHGVVVGDVGKDGGLLVAEVLVGVGRGGGTLIGIDEAGAEVVLLALRHERVGAGGPDDGHLGAFGDFAAGHGEGGAVGADDGEHLFMFGEALHGVGGFDLVGLVVDDDQFDGAVEDGRFELVGELDAFEFKLPAESVLAGQGQIDADFDGIGGLCRKGEAHAHDGHCGHAQKCAEFHVFHPPEKVVAPETEFRLGMIGCLTEKGAPVTDCF